MSEFTPTWQQPSHPDRLQVVPGDRPYSSAAHSLISLPAGALFAKISSATPAPADTYTSVGNGIDSRIELNSDLVYCNHSCDPTLTFDMSRMEVRVSEHRELKAGDVLTFFYPSTEWAMVQPFRCECGAGENRCLGWIAGASEMENSVLAQYWLNHHIQNRLAEKMPEISIMKQRLVEESKDGASSVATR